MRSAEALAEVWKKNVTKFNPAILKATLNRRYGNR